MVLFVSFASVTVFVASALAMTYHVPSEIPEGMVSDVLPVLVAPVVRLGTGRLASSVSFESRVELLDR